MSVVVKLDGDKEQDKQSEKVDNGKLSAKLNIRKTLDGNYFIYDHHYIDIVFMPEKMKIITFPYSEKTKIAFSDLVYATQDKLFDYLTRKGIVSPESVKGGNVFGSIEGSILTAKDPGIPVEELVLLNISRWLEEQRPALEFDKKYEEEFEKNLTDPDEEESTELGEVPQESEKGSIPKYQNRRYLGGWW